MNLQTIAELVVTLIVSGGFGALGVYLGHRRAMAIIPEEIKEKQASALDTYTQATELISKQYHDMLKRCNEFSKEIEELQKQNKQLQHEITVLKGLNTKLTNRIKQLEKENVFLRAENVRLNEQK